VPSLVAQALSQCFTHKGLALNILLLIYLLTISYINPNPTYLLTLYF
jgi:hypothetical protein